MHSIGYTADSMITMKLNPTQLLSLYMLPIAYDMDTMSTHVMRVTEPTAYEVSFDDYVRFISLETVSKSETSSMFLASDKTLNKCARDILPLINYLGDGTTESLVGKSFSTISKGVQDSLYALYSNFILNMTMLQIKMIEFLRWDNGKGTHVAHIIPTLGVFEVLTNIETISFVHEEGPKDIELVSVTEKLNTKVPSNLKIGVLGKSHAEYLWDNTEPRLLVDSYLYRGIYKYTEPLGRILPEKQRVELERKYNARMTYQSKVEKAQNELDAVLTKNNDGKQDNMTFLSKILAEVEAYISRGKSPGQTRGTIQTKYNSLTRLVANPEQPVELTEKEQVTMNKLIQARYKMENTWVTKPDKSTNRLVDRYPKYCYYELVSKLDEKYYNNETFEPLENSIMEVDVWVNLLLRLLDLCEDVHQLSGEVYMLSYQVSQTHTDASHGDYKLEGYNLTTVLA